MINLNAFPVELLDQSSQPEALSERYNPLKENDPLVQIAAAISPQPDLDETECRKINAAQYNARLVREGSLWSGDDLRTTDVKNTVMLVSWRKKVRPSTTRPGGSTMARNAR